MKVVDQSFEILDKLDRNTILKKLEYAGRTCYASTSNIREDSASDFISSLVKRGHESVLEHSSITVELTTNRGVMAEITRHRLASFSIMSTRYCNYSKDKFGNELTFINPRFDAYEEIESEKLEKLYDDWYQCMMDIEYDYLQALKNTTTEYARGLLPNDLMTKIVITANLREWKHIFKMRCDKAAHPHIRSLMNELRDEFIKYLPEIFEEENAN